MLEYVSFALGCLQIVVDESWCHVAHWVKRMRNIELESTAIVAKAGRMPLFHWHDHSNVSHLPLSTVQIHHVCSTESHHQ